MSFGDESLTHISPQMIESCFKDPKNAISKLFKMIHYDKNKKENYNVKMDSPDSKYIQMYKNGAWEYNKTKPALELIADTNFKILEKYNTSNLKQLEQEEWDKFYCQTLDEEQDVIDSTQNKLLLVIIKETC